MGEFNAYEFKWNPKAKVQYPNAQFTIVDQQNFDRILMDQDRMDD